MILHIQKPGLTHAATAKDWWERFGRVLEIGAKGESSVPIAEAEVAARLGLSEEERTKRLPSGKQTVLHNRLHWAKFYLTKAGLLTSLNRPGFAGG